MIRDAEIRRIAGAAGVEPRIVELDYALGWALRGIAGHESLSRRLVFKGGTCLRKCYFPGRLTGRKAEFEAEWERNLLPLLPPDAELEFPHAWRGAVEYASRMADGLDTDRHNSGRQ